jgi:protein SCO1/2
LLGLLIFVAACGREKATEDGKEFTVRGIVRGISPDRRTLDIQHEAIPNYMPEMTMPFVLKEGSDAAVKVGDAVSFRFVVKETDAEIDQVKLIAADQVKVAAATPPPASGASTSPRLKNGDPLPPLQLTNEKGETITAETYRGAPLVLTFIFTRCPVPNYCPLMTRNFAQLQDTVRNGSGALAKTRLLSISFDPEFDTPEVLKAAAEADHADPALWSFATGPKPQIDQLTRGFAVLVQPEGGTLSHSLATALIDADGRIVEIWRGNGWKPAEVVRKIESL